MRLATNLLIGFVVLIFGVVLRIFLFPEDSTMMVILPYIVLIPPLIHVCFLVRQLEHGAKIIEATLRPNISVGIIAFKNPEKIIGNPYQNIKPDSNNEELENTKIVIKNFSNIQGFVWTKLKLEINNKEANQHVIQKDYCFNRATWELDPNELLIVNILERSITDYKNQAINISLSVFFSHLRVSQPKDLDPRWIELTAYSFRKDEKQWLKNNLGVPFFLEGVTKE